MATLPHIYPVGATFFITFRLADSLPQSIVRELKQELAERKALIKRSISSPTEVARQIYLTEQDLFGKYDYQLDEKPYGNCLLDLPDVAHIVYTKILKFDKVYYETLGFCIMPNHVHMLVDTSTQLHDHSDEEPAGYVQVNTWMQLIKGGSAYEINKHLGRRGNLWDKESFDHWIRHEESLLSKMKYISDNPEKAGLAIEKNKAPFMYKSTAMK